MCGKIKEALNKTIDYVPYLIHSAAKVRKWIRMNSSLMLRKQIVLFVYYPRFDSGSLSEECSRFDSGSLSEECSRFSLGSLGEECSRFDSGSLGEECSRFGLGSLSEEYSHFSLGSLGKNTHVSAEMCSISL